MEEKYIIPNLKNACQVLKYLSSKEDGASIAEVTREMGLPRTSVLRILTTLQSENMVQLEGKKFSLGSSLVRLGLLAMNNLNIQTIARPVLEELTQETLETSHLAILAKDHTLIQDVCESPRPVHAASSPGAIAPLHCSSTGKVFLAYVLRERVDEIYQNIEIEQKTEKTVKTVTEIKNGIDETLAKGYGIDDEEFSLGVRCLAAPITDASGNVIAAIGITASTATFIKKKIPAFSKLVKEAAAKVSQQLSGSF